VEVVDGEGRRETAVLCQEGGSRAAPRHAGDALACLEVTGAVNCAASEDDRRAWRTLPVAHWAPHWRSTLAVMLTPPPLHPLEDEVMEEMWRRESATVREVLETLNHRGGRARAYTTIMTIMVRLDGKGLLNRRRDGRTDIYEPALSRDEYRAARASAEVEALVSRYGEAALVHFAREMRRLDPRRRAALQRLARRDDA